MLNFTHFSYTAFLVFFSETLYFGWPRICLPVNNVGLLLTLTKVSASWYYCSVLANQSLAPGNLTIQCLVSSNLTIHHDLLLYSWVDRLLNLDFFMSLFYSPPKTAQVVLVKITCKFRNGALVCGAESGKLNFAICAWFPSV